MIKLQSLISQGLNSDKLSLCLGLSEYGLDLFAETETVKKLWVAFEKDIRDFCHQLDSFFGLLREYKPKTQGLEAKVLRQANQMNRSLYELRSRFNSLYQSTKGEGNLIDKAEGLYEIAHDYYYQDVRPNAFSIKDLDTTDLLHFGEGRLNGNRVFYPNQMEYNSLYQENLLNGLEVLAHFEDYKLNEEQNIYYKAVILKELSKLVGDLAEESMVLMPKEAKKEKDLGHEFIKFTEELNEIFTLCNYSPIEIYRNLTNNNYEKLINNLLEHLKELIKENDSYLKLSKAARVIILLYLMRLQMIHKISDTEDLKDKALDDLSKKQLRLEYPDLNISYRAAVKLATDPFDKTNPLVDEFIDEKSLGSKFLSSREGFSRLEEELGPIRTLLGLNQEGIQNNINDFYNTLNSPTRNKQSKWVLDFSQIISNLIKKPKFEEASKLIPIIDSINRYAEIRGTPAVIKGAIKCIKTLSSALYHRLN